MTKQPQVFIVFVRPPTGSENQVGVFTDEPAAIEYAGSVSGTTRILQVPFYRYKVGRIKESTIMTITAIAVALALIAGSIVAIWKSHVEQQARDQQRWIQAQMGPVVYPPKPFGSHATPWRNRRMQ